MQPFLATVCLAASTVALAQPAAPLAFPEDAVAPARADLQQRLAGKVFNVKLADGAGWRLEYKTNGYYFVNTSAGNNDTGQWRAEDGKLCSKGRKSNSEGSCNEARVRGNELYVKRTNGEIIQLVPN